MIAKNHRHNSTQLFRAVCAPEFPVGSVRPTLVNVALSASPFAWSCFPYSLKGTVPESTPKELLTCTSPLWSQFSKELMYDIPIALYLL